MRSPIMMTALLKLIYGAPNKLKSRVLMDVITCLRSTESNRVKREKKIIPEHKNTTHAQLKRNYMLYWYHWTHNSLLFVNKIGIDRWIASVARIGYSAVCFRRCRGRPRLHVHEPASHPTHTVSDVALFAYVFERMEAVLPIVLGVTKTFG